jgi:hypothetical protein
MPYVYLIRSQTFTKIGIANDVESRLSHLQTGNPWPLELLACFYFQDAVCVERVLHQKFELARDRGEWFTLDSEQVSVAIQICELLGGVPMEDAPVVANAEAVDEAEEIQETQDILLGGVDWRLDRRNGRGFAIFKRGGTKQYLGYIGLAQMKDPSHPTVEEVDAVLMNNLVAGKNGSS